VLIFIGARFSVFHLMKAVYMIFIADEIKQRLSVATSVWRKFLIIMNILVNANTLYYGLYTLFAFLGVFTHVFFFAFHLYEIMNQ